MITLNLPWPPSVNHYWRWTHSGPRISRKGREYRTSVMAAVLEQGSPRAEGRLKVTVTACPPDRRARDLDNLNKSLLDACEAAGVFENDSQIDDLRVVRSDVVKGGIVTILIEEVSQ